MNVCPVCEHVQAGGDECAVCGKRLAGPGAPSPAFAHLDALEPTRMPSAGELPGEGVPGLEPTLHPDAGAVSVPGIEIEPTLAIPVEVSAPAIDGIERTEVEGIPGDAPTALPEHAICRYCRTPAPAGTRLCGRCGMRLPLSTPSARVPSRAEPVRCPACATLNTTTVCTGCGGMVRFLLPSP